MTKEEIKQQLRESHDALTGFILSLTDNDFLFAANGKWTAGQQLDHILRSVGALNKGLAMPKLVIRLYVGKANRPSREYDVLVAKYKSKLELGGKAPGQFIPKPVLPSAKKQLGEKLTREVHRLCRKIDRYSEKQLDYYILPHPLLGKLTVREMFYFTIYHAHHHCNNTLDNLKRYKNAGKE